LNPHWFFPAIVARAETQSSRGKIIFSGCRMGRRFPNYQSGPPRT
jgi:hypothetical protein